MSQEVDGTLHKANVAAHKVARAFVRVDEAFDEYLETGVFEQREVRRRNEAYETARAEAAIALEHYKILMEDGLPKEAA